MKKIVISVVLFISVTFFLIFSNKENPNTITVSGGVTTESQIMGNMISELIKHETKYDTKFYNNLGSAVINQNAMLKGDLDISSARYTGTDLVSTLGYEASPDHDKDQEIVQREFKKRYNFDWMDSYGFSNQFVILATKDFAQKNNIKKISDLRKISPKLTIGMDQTWYKRSGDGFEAFKDKYKLEFKRSYPMQVGLLYDALRSNSLDLIVGYSTDPRIKAYQLVQIKDDLNFFPNYAASMVVNQKVFDKYPDLKPVLERLSNKISNKEMIELNYKSDEKFVEPRKIAHEFLERNNYFAK